MYTKASDSKFWNICILVKRPGKGTNKPKHNTHYAFYAQNKIQSILYNVHMAVLYHIRPGMESVTKTQTSKVSSFSEAAALKAASNSGEFTTDQFQERKEQYSSNSRNRQSTNVLLYPNAHEREGAHPISDSRPVYRSRVKYSLCLLGCMACGFFFKIYLCFA